MIFKRYVIAQVGSLLLGALLACGDGLSAPIAPSPTAFRLSAKNGVAIGQAADVSCEGVLSGDIQLRGSGNGSTGQAILSHVLRDRVLGVITVVDTAAFQQVVRRLFLTFPVPAGFDPAAPGLNTQFTILNDETIETTSVVCFPGYLGPIRDVLKVLRYERTD